MPLDFKDDVNEKDLSAVIDSLFDKVELNQKTILTPALIVAILRCLIFADMYKVPVYEKLANKAMELLISGPGKEGGSGRRDMRHILTAALAFKRGNSDGNDLAGRLMR